jgi:undecaprenyl-diphosphatase
MLERELQWEKDLFFFLNGSESVVCDHFFWLYSNKWMGIFFYLCFFILFIYKRNWKEIVLILLSITLVILISDQIASGFFKPVFHRFRPTHHPDFQDQVDIVMGERGGKYGFISGHAANAFGFATFMALVFRNRIFTTAILLFAVLNGYSRIYLGLHFISDVIVGALVGIAAGYTVYQLYNLGRVYILQTPKSKLKQPVYSKQSAYLICMAFVLYLAILLIFNNQIISMLAK